MFKTFDDTPIIKIGKWIIRLFCEVFKIKDLPGEIIAYCVFISIILGAAYGIYFIKTCPESEENLVGSGSLETQIITHGGFGTAFVFVAFLGVYLAGASLLMPHYVAFLIISAISIFAIPAIVVLVSDFIINRKIGAYYSKVKNEYMYEKTYTRGRKIRNEKINDIYDSECSQSPNIREFFENALKLTLILVLVVLFITIFTATGIMMLI